MNYNYIYTSSGLYRELISNHDHEEIAKYFQDKFTEYNISENDISDLFNLLTKYIHKSTTTKCLLDKYFQTTKNIRQYIDLLLFFRYDDCDFFLNYLVVHHIICERNFLDKIYDIYVIRDKIKSIVSYLEQCKTCLKKHITERIYMAYNKELLDLGYELDIGDGYHIFNNKFYNISCFIVAKTEISDVIAEIDSAFCIYDDKIYNGSWYNADSTKNYISQYIKVDN